jgi:hypothetical protein
MPYPKLVSLHRFGAVIAAGLVTLGCHDGATVPTEPGLDARRDATTAPAPLVTIPVGNGTGRIWAYVTDDLATPQDPVNLIFSGYADPREIRNALFGLDGSRSPAFPPVFPFTCTWSDAIGGLMAGYSAEAGWAGGAVQLQCGDYGPIRFHLRLFKMGRYTIGNAHFEVLIPGTTDHQVLSWELAEQLVTFDLTRTGLLGSAPAPTGLINDAPFYRGIPAAIYNGLPADLRALIGGPSGDVAADVGIATDGHAMEFVLADRAPEARPNASQRLILQWNQIVPKPFCASGPADYLLVQGPVSLEQTIRTHPDGELRERFSARGTLLAVPVDPLSGQPSGVPFRAEVSEDQDSRTTSEGGYLVGLQEQKLLPSSLPGAGRLRIRFRADPGKEPSYSRTVECH